jgi:uncharacterized protein (TIGR02996 family)
MFYAVCMKPEEARFLERICAEPAEDGPRLIFADWLDEHDDPRGEFIRVQIALAGLPADDSRRTALLDREATLLARHHAAWSEPLRGVAGWTEFRRGFVETAIVEAGTFLRRAGDLFRLAPVQHVRILDVGSSLVQLTSSPFLARLSSLTICAQHIGNRLTQALADSPHLGGLHSLNIGRNRIGDRGVERLAWSHRWQDLIELDISDNAIGDIGARAIAESTNFAKLQTLELRHNELSRAGLGYLCASKTLASVRNLGLRLNYIGAPRDCSPPPTGVVRLSSLDLSENGLTPDGIEFLTALPGVGNLAQLVLEKNEIGNAGATTLSNWSGAMSLRSLMLAGNRIGDDGARDLARSPYLHRLVELDLSDNPVHDSGASELMKGPALQRLRRLGLPHLGLTPQVRRALTTRYPG